MKELSMWNVLKSPVITEKSILLKEQSAEDDEARC